MVDDFIAHYGKRGMKWGVRRDPVTGIRPIAQTLNDSKFGKAAQKNVNRHDKNVANRKAEDQVILDARSRIAGRQKAYGKAIDRVKVFDDDSAQSRQFPNRERDLAEKHYFRKLKDLNNPADSRMARKKTHGEQKVDMIMGSALAAVGVASVVAILAGKR